LSHRRVSNAEGQVVDLTNVEPGAGALELAGANSDPRVDEVILGESIRVARQRGPVLITETHHGFVYANAGVHRSNAPRPDTVLLPALRPRRLRGAARARREAARGTRLAVIIVDTMGRPLRDGIVGTARLVDPNNYELATSMVAIADEIASAADLVIGKLGRVPAAPCRGVEARHDGTARRLMRERASDLSSRPGGTTNGA
jgi:coenzyme F420-0:L-glutamate ligase / coenzyme F420-1:gamma-L-glutamate ligase